MKTGKSIIVLTNFWDANTLIDYGFVFFKCKDNSLCKVNLNSEKGDANYSVRSIAISHPPLDKLDNLKNMSRLDFFCPTYDMLTRYKKDHDWDAYKKDYASLLSGRRSDLKDWMDSLKPEHVYLLCCWERHPLHSHCHRELLHKMFLSSEVVLKKAVPVYRHGDRVHKDRKTGNINMPVGFTTEVCFVPAVVIDENGNVISVAQDETVKIL